MAEDHSDEDAEAIYEVVEQLRGFLRRQCNALNHAICVLMASKNYELPDSIEKNFSLEAREIAPIMVQGVGSSCHTLLLLLGIGKLQTRDCFPIARSIVEGVVNVCYILAEGDTAARRAREHAFQKSYRDQKRILETEHAKIAMELKGRPEAQRIEGLSEALQKWTTKSGGERSDWIDLSIHERINIIGREFGSRTAFDLSASSFNIYRHSSEILHGTFFGSLFFFGVTQGEPGRAAIAGHLVVILVSVIHAVSALLTAVGKYLGASEDNNVFQMVGDRIMNEMREIPYFKDYSEDGSPWNIRFTF